MIYPVAAYYIMMTRRSREAALPDKKEITEKDMSNRDQFVDSLMDKEKKFYLDQYLEDDESNENNN